MQDMGRELNAAKYTKYFNELAELFDKYNDNTAGF